MPTTVKRACSGYSKLHIVEHDFLYFAYECHKDSANETSKYFKKPWCNVAIVVVSQNLWFSASQIFLPTLFPSVHNWRKKNTTFVAKTKTANIPPSTKLTFLILEQKCFVLCTVGYDMYKSTFPIKAGLQSWVCFVRRILTHDRRQ